MDDFDCVAGTGRILGKLDLAGDAAAQRSSQNVLIKSGWH